MTIAARPTSHSEDAFKLAARLHSEAIYVYNWALGPYSHRGGERDAEQDRSARATALYVGRQRGWTKEQVREYATDPEDFPMKVPKEKGAGRLTGGSSSGGWDAVDGVLDRLARQKPEPPNALEHVSQEAVKSLIGVIGRLPPLKLKRQR